MHLVVRLFALTFLASSSALADGNVLPNGTFEKPQNDLAEGWLFQADVGEAVGVRREKGGVDDSANLGATLAKAGQCDFRPAAGMAAVRPQAAYLLTCSVRASNVEGGSHSIELQWFGPNGFISRDIDAAKVTGKWVRVAVGPVAPPKGADKVVPLLRCYGAGTYGFDSVGLWEVTPLPKNALQNPGFESDGDGDGVPDGWQAVPGDGAPADAAAWDAQVAHTGQYSVRLRLPAGATARPAWVQKGVSVTASARYELAASVTSDRFGREMRMAVEWVKGGKVLSTDEFRDQTSGGWQRKTVRALAPPQAEQANVVLQLTGEGSVWFDDVTLTEEELVANLDLWLEKPNVRGLIRDGVDARVLRARCRMETKEPGVRLQFRLTDSAGKPLAEETPKVQNGEATWAPDIAKLARGAYRVVAEAANPDGRVLASALACLDIVPPDAPGITFREDHIALVEGKPWFPIGVCSMPVLDPVAERLAQSGFNLIVTGGFTQEPKEKVQEILERAKTLGLRLVEWNNGHVYGKISPEERRRLCATSVERVAGHPTFLGWMCDEALWNGVPLSDMEDGYLAARAASPTLVFWANQAPRNTIADLARYTHWCDVTGMDIYPVEGAEHSDLPNKTLSVVGDEMEKQAKTVSGRKPVWAVLQGFGWSAWEKDEKLHKRAPTWEETRFMAYDAILHGATGVIYWGASYEKQDAPIWDHLRRIARELADLTPALVSEERVKVGAQAPVIAQARRANGKVWVIAVNESAEPVKAQLTGLPNGTLQRVGEEGTVEVVGGKLVEDSAGYGVHVYRVP